MCIINKTESIYIIWIPVSIDRRIPLLIFCIIREKKRAPFIIEDLLRTLFLRSKTSFFYTVITTLFEKCSKFIEIRFR